MKKQPCTWCGGKIWDKYSYEWLGEKFVAIVCRNCGKNQNSPKKFRHKFAEFTHAFHIPHFSLLHMVLLWALLSAAHFLDRFGLFCGTSGSILAVGLIVVSFGLNHIANHHRDKFLTK